MILYDMYYYIVDRVYKPRSITGGPHIIAMVDVPVMLDGSELESQPINHIVKLIVVP